MTDLQNSVAGGGVLAAVLEDIADMLRAAQGSVFADGRCAVICEDDGDLDNRISAALNANGLCATVMLTGLEECVASLPNPTFRRAGLVVEICECSSLNRALRPLRTALDAAEQAAKILHQHHVRTPLVSKRIVLVKGISRFHPPPAPADVCFHVSLSTGEVALPGTL